MQESISNFLKGIDKRLGIPQKELRDMEPEELKIKRDMALIWLQGALGVVFAIVLAAVIGTLTRSPSLEVGVILFYFTITLLAVFPIIFIILLMWVTPVRRQLYQIAQEYARRRKEAKKKETTAILKIVPLE
jgi:hypothetical protein